MSMYLKDGVWKNKNTLELDLKLCIKNLKDNLLGSVSSLLEFTLRNFRYLRNYEKFVCWGSGKINNNNNNGKCIYKVNEAL